MPWILKLIQISAFLIPAMLLYSLYGKPNFLPSVAVGLLTVILLILWNIQQSLAEAWAQRDRINTRLWEIQKILLGRSPDR